MRRINLAGVIACGWMLACMSSAVMADCGCNGMSSRSYNALCGPPCFSPPGCTAAPGCCECPPTACDNAWEGYCQHKAKWQAYFAKVGTPRPSYYYGNRGNCGMPTPAVRDNQAECGTAPKYMGEPEPAAKPVKPELPPAPAPEKTSRVKVLYPWMR